MSTPTARKTFVTNHAHHAPVGKGPVKLGIWAGVVLPMCRLATAPAAATPPEADGPAHVDAGVTPIVPASEPGGAAGPPRSGRIDL
jgi:hypothetical protein